MIIFKEAAPLSQYLEQQKNEGRTIGFVPTMGALHEGHLKLLSESKQHTDLSVCSIFVNPTQFNNAEDFKHYPSTIEQDILKLEAARCDVLFLPPVAEIYPAGHIKKVYELGPIETVLEGAFRPGHFQGVCQVVDRLLEITEPDTLFMGQKDFQQCMVVRKLLQLTGRTGRVELVIVPTVREEDGLAMSSRNLRLSPEHRQLATRLYEVLRFIREHQDRFPPAKLGELGREKLASQGFMVDYVSVVAAEDLQEHNNGEPRVALVAASIGPVRLIDNLPLS